MKITEIYENKIKTAIDECINRGAPLSENVFRVGSDAYFEVFKLARNLVESGYIKVDDNLYKWWQTFPYPKQHEKLLEGHVYQDPLKLI